VVVGVNKFQIKEPAPANLLKVDPSIQVAQIAKIKAVKEARDNDAVKRHLAIIKATAQTSDNLMPKILDAVKQYATLGEIAGTLEEVFGVHKESVVL
ncbi:methylmalonyl-CoA mutase, partial [bacterium]|nr:methylmalonyl-CoA mutase [bacterium]